MKKITKVLLILALSTCATVSLASSLTVTMYRVAAKGHGKSVGTIRFEDSSYGLLILPSLQGLKPGNHGFHIHVKPSCNNFAKEAGGHFDPKKTGKHLGPFNDKGHLGDMPALFVNKEGKTSMPSLAPRLKVAEIKNHAIIIHAGGDNYSDEPKALGGGGARVACGVAK